MVVMNAKGLSESLKNVCRKHGVQVHFKHALPSKASWWLPRIRILSQRRVVSSIDTNVTGWNVMMNV